MSKDETAESGLAMRILDVIAKFAGIATPLVLGWLTYHLTIEDQKKRATQATTDTVLKIVELSVGKDDATKNVGLTMIAEIDTDGMGGLIDDDLRAQAGFHKLLSDLRDTISSGSAGTSPGPATSAAAPAPPHGTAPAPTDPDDAVEKWVYVGTWDGNHWATRHIAIEPNMTPQDLKNRNIRVPKYIGNIYVRSGPSTPTALAPVVDVLHPGQSVTVLEVRTGSDPTHYWARIKTS